MGKPKETKELSLEESLGLVASKPKEEKETLTIKPEDLNISRHEIDNNVVVESKSMDVSDDDMIKLLAKNQALMTQLLMEAKTNDKTIEDVSPKQQQEDMGYMRAFTTKMLQACKDAQPRQVTVNPMLQSLIGKTYTYTFNGIPVTIVCDGEPRMYPDFIANNIEEKLAEVMRQSVSENRYKKYNS